MSTFVFAHINIRMQPIDRGESFEDPLLEALEEQELGTVTGGGCGLTENHEIEFCGGDIELEDLEEGIPFLVGLLEELGAPAGSRLEYQDGDREVALPFGKEEGVGVYLDGVGLPKEVYETSDVNELIDRLDGALGDDGGMRCHWQGPEETALYFYGPSRATLRAKMADVLASHALCKGARVVDIA